MEPIGKKAQKPLEQRQKEKAEEPGVIGKWFAEYVPFASWFFGGVEEKEKAYEEHEGGPIVGEPEPTLSSREAGQGIKRPVELKTFGLVKVPRDDFSEIIADGYNERVYEKHRGNWDIVFTKLGRDVFKNFDRGLYEGDPMKFFSDIGRQERAVEIINELSWKDKEFGEAWEAIREEQIAFYQGMVDEYYKDDAEYKERKEAWEDFTERWNEAVDKFHNEGDDSLLAVLEKDKGDHNKIGEYLHQKNTEYFSGVVETYYAKDERFQTALKVVQFIKERIGEEEPEDMIDELSKEYNKGADFKRALDYINGKESQLRTLFSFGYSQKDIDEKVAIVGPRIGEGVGKEIQKAKDFIRENPGVIITPAVGFVAYMLASPVTVPLYAIEGVFGLRMTGKVYNAVMNSMKEVGVDLEANKRDREIRRPYLGKIFSLPVSKEEKLALLTDLHENGLLFEDDLEDVDEDLKKQFFQKLKKEEGQLLSLGELADRRKARYALLSDVHTSDDMKVNALMDLYEQGVLFKSDLDVQNLIKQNVKDKFFAKVVAQGLENEGFGENDLRDMDALKKWRNAALFLVKATKPGMEEKFESLKELHRQGLLFKEDVEQLRDTIGGKKLEKRLKDEIEGFDFKELPDLKTHYHWAKHTLRRADDQKRMKYVERLEKGDGKEQLEVLQKLQKMGLCFQEDLEKVDEDVKKEFGEKVKINLSKLPNRADYYRMGLGERFALVVPNPSKVIGAGVALGGIAMATGVLGTGGMMIGGLAATVLGEDRLKAGASLAFGGLATVFPNLIDDPTKIVTGALQGVKGVVEITAEAMDETFGSFLWKTTFLEDRLVKVMPTNESIKRQGTFAANRVIGTVKWGVLGAAIGSQIGGVALGSKVGFGVGSFFGACSSNGRVKQVPAGGFIRAIKFSSVGALVGSILPIVAGVVIGGLTLGGLIASGGILIVGPMLIGLIIPCLLFGAFAGYQIAGFTGKDEAAEDPAMKKLEYEVPSFETAKMLLFSGGGLKENIAAEEI